MASSIAIPGLEQTDNSSFPTAQPLPPQPLPPFVSRDFRFHFYQISRVTNDIRHCPVPYESLSEYVIRWSIMELSEHFEGNQGVPDADVEKIPRKYSSPQMNSTMKDTLSPAPDTNFKESSGSATECSSDVKARKFHDPAESLLEVRGEKLPEAEETLGCKSTAENILESSERLSSDNRVEDNAEPLPKNETQGPTTNFDIPRIHLIVETHETRMDSVYLRPEEFSALTQHWHLPPEFIHLLPTRDINSGIFWNKLRSIDGIPHLQVILCFDRNGMLVLSHNISARTTKGLWVRGGEHLVEPVLSSITSDDPDLHHPLRILFSVLEVSVHFVNKHASEMNNRYTQAAIDLNIALTSQSADNFEAHFLKANKAYFQLPSGIYAMIDRIENLADFINRSFAVIEGIDEFSCAYADQHVVLLDRLEMIKKRMNGIKALLKSKDEYMQRCFGILHSLINMRDSFVNQELASSSESIARDSKRDSSAMKTLAVLTTVFLPSTFVATMFSMPFFSFALPSSDPTISSVSPQFWIYWAVSIPLTIITILVWSVWFTHTERRRKQEDSYAVKKDRTLWTAFNVASGPEQTQYTSSSYAVVEFLRKARHRSLRRDVPDDPTGIWRGGRSSQNSYYSQERERHWDVLLKVKEIFARLKWRRRTGGSSSSSISLADD